MLILLKKADKSVPDSRKTPWKKAFETDQKKKQKKINAVLLQRFCNSTKNARTAVWPHSVHLYEFIFRGNINDDYSAFRLCCITPDFITTNSNQFPQPERKTTLSLTHTVLRPPVTGSAQSAVLL